MFNKKILKTDFENRLFKAPFFSHIYTSPILTLPCQHNFCQVCLKSLVQATLPSLNNNDDNTNKQFNCPVCRKSAKLENVESIDAFPRNLCVENIVEKYLEDKQGETDADPVGAAQPAADQNLTVTSATPTETFDAELIQALNRSIYDNGSDYLDDAVIQDEALMQALFLSLGEASAVENDQNDENVGNVGNENNQNETDSQNHGQNPGQDQVENNNGDDTNSSLLDNDSSANSEDTRESPNEAENTEEELLIRVLELSSLDY